MRKWKMLEIFTVKEEDTDTVVLMKHNMRKMAGMAGLAIILTLVLIFAMSAAWYSNIIHADSLVFTADSWDFTFEGDVEIESETQVAPGMSGILPLEVTNDSADPIAVVVNVDKALLGEELAKRIYFYVDDQTTSNEEVIDKVYINEADGYTYPIMDGEKLVLSSEVQTAPVLKWEWVYELQGYYVLGTMTEEMQEVERYLRPVTYDSTKATYDEGVLRAINGVGVIDWLRDLTEKDGYPGTVGVDEDGNDMMPVPVEGYYPVSVDKNGFGIWIYLYNETEIEAANEYDTELMNKSEEERSFTVRVYLTGQNYVQETIEIYSKEDLENALAMEGAYRLELMGDTTVYEPVKVEKGRDVTLDLNTATLYVDSAESPLEVESGASLTVMNGSLEPAVNAAAVPEYLITSKGGEVNLSGVRSLAGTCILDVQDDQSEGQDSRIRIHNCELTTSDVVLNIHGNGSESARKTFVSIEESVLNSGYVGVMCSGNDTASGTDIRIYKSTVTGTWASIYHPQKNSTMRIEDSTLSGYTGIAIKGGTVDIVNTQINGTGGEELEGDPEVSKSGFADTGDGIYVETNYENPIAVTVSGENTVVNSLKNQAVRVYEQGTDYAYLVVYGGTFSSDVEDYLPADGSRTITKLADGKYKVDKKAASLGEEEEE